MDSSTRIMKRPLGTFETAQVLTGKVKSFNLVIALQLEKGPVFDVLQRALKCLHDRHPLLRTTIDETEGRPFFRVAGENRVLLRQIPRSSEHEWKRVVEYELNTPLPLSPGPLFKASYVANSGYEQPCELVLTAHHAILDGVSAARLLHDLLGLCESFAAGDEPSGFEPLGLLPAAEQLFPAPYRGVRGLIKQAGFAGRNILQGLRYLQISRKLKEPAISRHGSCRIVTFELPVRQTRQLRIMCRKQRVTLNSLLCAVQLVIAQRHGFAGRAVPLRHFVFADLRPYLQPAVDAGNLGAYFAMLHLISVLDANMPTWELAKALNEQIHVASRRGEKFTSVSMSKLLMTSVLAKPRFRMGHAALAFLGPVSLSACYGEIKPCGLHAFVSNIVLGPVYTANARIFMGQLVWDMIYLDCDMDTRTAERIAGDILQELKGLA